MACSHDQKSAALRLTEKAYASRGLCRVGTPKLESIYNDDPYNIITILVGVEGSGASGTASLYYDSLRGLPLDAIFHDEIQDLRTARRRIAEVSRLALDADAPRKRELLLLLLNLLFIHARHVRKVNDFVIEVHPRHALFYRRALGFESRGSVRPCPRVNGAPAQLLHFNLERYEAAKKAACQFERSRNTGWLYARFLSLKKEKTVARMLESSQTTQKKQTALRTHGSRK